MGVHAATTTKAPTFGEENEREAVLGWICLVTLYSRSVVSDAKEAFLTDIFANACMQAENNVGKPQHWSDQARHFSVNDPLE